MKSSLLFIILRFENDVQTYTDDHSDY